MSIEQTRKASRVHQGRKVDNWIGLKPISIISQYKQLAVFQRGHQGLNCLRSNLIGRLSLDVRPTKIKETSSNSLRFL